MIGERLVQRVLCCISLVFLITLQGVSEENQKERSEKSSRPEKTEEKKKVWGLRLIERINSLIDQLREGNQQKRKAAKEKLLEIGSPALPYLREEIRSTDLQGVYNLIQQIELISGSGTGARGTSSSLQSLSPDDRAEGEQEKKGENVELSEKDMTSEEREKFYKLLTRRYRDARRWGQKGDYKKAKNILNALLTIAPNHPRRSKIKGDLRKIEENIVEERIIRARIRLGKTKFEYGSTTKIKLSFKNVTDSIVDLYFQEVPQKYITLKDQKSTGKPKPDNQSGSQEQKFPDSGKRVKVSDERAKESPIFLRFHVLEWDMTGTSYFRDFNLEKRIPKHIRLAPGASWSTTTMFNFSNLDPTRRVRQYTLKAKVRPALIVRGSKQYSRWIHFPASVPALVFPRGTSRLLPVNIEKIRTAVENERWTRVFYQAFHLPENQEKKARELFEKLESEKENNQLSKMFRFLRKRISEGDL